MFENDLDRAKSEADIALSLNPNFALAYSNLGSIHVYSGEPLAGITAIERAMRLDPAWSQQYLHFPPAPNSALIDEFSGTAAYKCGFNRSMQQFGGIVPLVFRSLMSFSGARSIFWPRR
jgi:hypothetical protein